MKHRYSLNLLALASSASLLATQAHAAQYYWDTIGTTSGLGNNAGTWGTNASGAVSTGAVAGSASPAPNPPPIPQSPRPTRFTSGR